jgi:hypothetical protein
MKPFPMTHRRLKQLIISLAVLPALGVTAVVQASDNAAGLRFENHHFTPETLSVPADQPLTISVVNASKETIEFESFKLNREKNRKAATCRARQRGASERKNNRGVPS